MSVARAAEWVVTEESSDEVGIRRLTAAEAHERVGALADLLMDCVEGGASVGFMAPLQRQKAVAFWAQVADGVATGERILLAAQDAAGDVVGTVHVVFARPENQPHRADVAKMLVRRSHRERGLGARLMGAAEEAARAEQRTLLVLDTVTGSAAERLYLRLGWTPLGIVPGYALMPDGAPCAATFFYKALDGG